MKRFSLYAASIIATALLCATLGERFVSVYWMIAFWSLVALDFTRSHREDFAKDATSPLADRIIGYIFVAPFILPARALELIPAKASR